MTELGQDPSSRKLKVLAIGAGLSSIQMAYMIQKHCQNVELVIYENRYPGNYNRISA
jgi:cation diffusion facilitator CzcD-associated flavoprotein CzcO